MRSSTTTASLFLLALGAATLAVVSCGGDGEIAEQTPVAEPGDGGSSGEAGPGSPGEALLTVDAKTVAPKTTVSTSTIDRYAATIEVPGLGAVDESREGKTYKRLSIFDGGTLASTGKPQIPYVTKVLVLPRLEDGSEVEPRITVTPSDPVTLTDIDVYPAQEPPPDRPLEDVLALPTPPFTRDDAAYASRTPYPQHTFDSERQRVGDLDLLVLRIYPVQVDAGGRSATLTRKFDVDVDMNPTKAALTPAAAIDEVDGDGTPTVSHRGLPGFIDNAHVIKDVVWRIPSELIEPQVADDPMAHLMIITSDAFSQLTTAFVRHKRQQGLRVKVAWPAAPGASSVSSAELRAYLKETWNTDGVLTRLFDPDEPGLSPGENIQMVTAFRHRSSDLSRRLLGFDVLYAGTPSSTHALDIAFGVRKPGGEIDATYTLSMTPSAAAGLAFEVTKAGTTPPQVVARGSAVKVKHGYRLEMPSDDILPNASSEVWVRVTQSTATNAVEAVPNVGYARIQGAINDRRWMYLLLLGDTDTIATNYDVSSFEGGPPTDEDPLKLRVATDFYYSTVGHFGTSFFQSLYVGRLPVKSSDEVTRALQKIITYEKDDPFARFKPRVLVTGQFQDDPDTKNDLPPDGRANRPFIDTTERVRDYFVARGNETVRVYSAADELTPTAFLDGRPLPAELRKPAFAWNGTAADLQSVLNDYRTHLVLHRDHAGIGGWGAPNFSVGHVTALHAPPTSPKGMLPVFFSINCSSGYFDQETDFFEDAAGVRTPNDRAWSKDTSPNFAETLLRHEGGAVAVIAASRVSYSGHNDTLVDGMMRALYPDYPTFKPTTEASEVQVLGSVLAWGKLHHAIKWSGNSKVKYVYEEFNLLGDPSLRVSPLPR